jgi:hypothetical protein
MTTHDHPTLAGSSDEFRTGVEGRPPVSDEAHTAVQGQPPMSEQTAPDDRATGLADPSKLSTGPAPAAREERSETPASVAPVDPSMQSAESASGERQSSSEQMLFAHDELAELRGRWAAVQAAFVDDPKECVQKADVLVSDLVEQLTNGFASVRGRLEEQWSRGEQASTEDLRVALMHYREFFERLLAV